jgi:hypothetical protein
MLRRLEIAAIIDPIEGICMRQALPILCFRSTKLYAPSSDPTTLQTNTKARRTRPLEKI